MMARTTLTTDAPPPGTLSRKADGWIRETGKAEAEFHQKTHTRKHFQRGAKTRYGYRARSAKYQKAKKRLTGQTQPLVFSGRTRDQVQSQFNVKGTATKGAKLIRVAPFKGGSGRFRLKPGLTTLTQAQDTVLQLVEEIRVVLPEEVQEIGAHGARVYDQFVQAGVSVARRRRKLS